MLIITVASLVIGFLLALRFRVWALVPFLGVGPIWLIFGLLAGYPTAQVLIGTFVYECALSGGFFVGSLVRTREKGRNPIVRFTGGPLNLRHREQRPKPDVPDVA
jgi:hypothetical protein